MRTERPNRAFLKVNADRPLACRGARYGRIKTIVFRVVFVCVVMAASQTLPAQEERLIDQEPFDRIVLNANNGNQVLVTQPVDRAAVKNPTRNGSLRVRLVSNPDEEIDVAWTGIERIELFEVRVLNEARQMMQAGKFDDAFEYLKFVHDNYPDTDGLEATLDQLLFTEASSLYREGKLERALLLLDEIYQRTPGRSNLDVALGRVLQTQFVADLRARDYQQALRLYRLANEKYRRSIPQVIDRFRAQLEQVGDRTLATAKAAFDAGKLREAYLGSRQVLEIWPETDGAEEFAQLIAQRYPLLRVGVDQLAVAEAGQTWSDARFHWAQRRVQRLRMRKLIELTGVGPDGGEYTCPIGKAETPTNNLALQIHTDPANGNPMTSVHVAQLLLRLGSPETSIFDTAWAALVDRIGTADLMTTNVTLRRPHLRVVSLLDVPLNALPSQDVWQRWSPYRLESSSDTESQWMVNADYLAGSVTQPREVIETRFDTPQRAVQALRRGEVDLIDRAFPADVFQASRDNQLSVKTYRFPSLHFLVPNHDRPYTGNRIFRRGLAYAIDRQKILRRDLLAGHDLVGCQVISGPFSPGLTSDDPMAYAYDPRIEPRAYDPRHAKTLMTLAEVELIAVAKKNDTPPPKLEELTLLIPDGEIARVASAEIVEDLKIIGVACRVVTLPPGAMRPTDDNWDLLYVDCVIPEPLVDARRLLSSRGIASSPSPHVNLALRQLDAAISWKQAGERLRVIHQLCFDDTTVIPLWQIVDHMIHRAGLEGIGEQPVLTYQNIEGWRLQPE